MPRQKKNLPEGYIESRSTSGKKILAKRNTYFLTDLQREFIRELSHQLRTTKNYVLQMAFDVLIKQYPEVYKNAQDNLKNQGLTPSFSTSNTIEKNDEI